MTTTTTKPMIEPKMSPGKRIYNFSAGPAVLPEEVIHQAQQDILNIFDSGIGGLSVLKKIKAILPNENLIYFCDSKNVPYGEKSADEVRDLVK